MSLICQPMPEKSGVLKLSRTVGHPVGWASSLYNLFCVLLQLWNHLGVYSITEYVPCVSSRFSLLTNRRVMSNYTNMPSNDISPCSSNVHHYNYDYCQQYNWHHHNHHSCQHYYPPSWYVCVALSLEHSMGRSVIFSQKIKIILSDLNLLDWSKSLQWSWSLI